MAGCCGDTKFDSSTHHSCPVNGQVYPAVDLRTVLHQVERPWAYSWGDMRHFFCDAPDCDVVYFTQSNQVINRDQLRVRIGQKEQAPDRPLCYCYGVSHAQSLADAAIKPFVIAQTKVGNCSCEVRNPSGRCCLKDFPKDTGQ